MTTTELIKGSAKTFDDRHGYRYQVQAWASTRPDGSIIDRPDDMPLVTVSGWDERHGNWEGLIDELTPTGARQLAQALVEAAAEIDGWA